jgi:hypothetical protein
MALASIAYTCFAPARAAAIASTPVPVPMSTTMSLSRSHYLGDAGEKSGCAHPVVQHGDVHSWPTETTLAGLELPLTLGYVPQDAPIVKLYDRGSEGHPILHTGGRRTQLLERFGYGYWLIKGVEDRKSMRSEVIDRVVGNELNVVVGVDTKLDSDTRLSTRSGLRLDMRRSHRAFSARRWVSDRALDYGTF